MCVPENLTRQSPPETSVSTVVNRYCIGCHNSKVKAGSFVLDSILAAPLVLDLALFSDFAQRAGLKGIQEWLSFYYKSPMAAPGLHPEHDLFIQQTKLKNTLRHLAGEEQITHLALEYYL